MPFRLLTPQEVSRKVAGRGARDFPVRHVGDGFGSAGPVRGGGGVEEGFRAPEFPNTEGPRLELFLFRYLLRTTILCKRHPVQPPGLPKSHNKRE